ncbi:DUF4878 domain-containing protein [Porticoccaceae bacterium LTM1]|nr:DUF4878 domain-containing protein [Porticoccaceae bacterium LTM1]
MRQVRSFLLLFLAVVSLTACSANPTPESVTKQFWQAMAEGDTNRAKELATEDSQRGVSKHEQTEMTDLLFGDAVIEGDSARVPTAYQRSTAKRDLVMKFDTVLVREDEQWKVEYDASMRSMLANSFNNLGTALQGNIEEMGEAVGEVVGEAMTEAAQEFNRALQDFAEEMQQVADELRKAEENKQKEKK